MTSDDPRAFRSLLVAGAGIVGLSAALAFKRALPWADVTVLQVAPDPAALADRLGATLPPIARFHAAIGVDELDLVRRNIAIHHLATRFGGSGSGAPWVHGFGDVGLAAAGIPFHQLWIRARAAGRAEPVHHYSAAAVLGEAKRFVHPSNDSASPLSTYLYALALDPDAYRLRLAELARDAGITTVVGEIAGIERRDDGGVASLLTGDGQRLEADLYLDCAGPSAPLLSRIDERFEEWRDWLPFDRISISSVEPNPTPLSEVSFDSTGWTARHGWRSVSATSSTHAEPDGAVAIRPGRRPAPWTANVLGIGDGAVALDPLHGTNLHLAQSAILRALELIPGRDCNPIETAEYNRRSAEESTRVRDFVALHYLESSPAPPPDSLALSIEQFAARGRLAFFEEESFSMHSWAAAMFAAGIDPAAPAASAGAVDLDAAVMGMERLAERLRALSAQLPPYAEYLARMARGG